MKRTIAALLLVLALLPSRAGAQAEESDWTYNSNFNFGFNLYFFSEHGQRFPGWKAFVGMSLAATNKHNFVLNYGPALALYSKSLGASLNPLSNDVQLDFANSFTVGGWWGDPYYTKYFRTLGNAAYFNTALNVRNAVLLSSIFVFNNHKRNQNIGSVTLSFGDFTINYYNDGGAPIEWMPLSDHFDRYWTGGLGLFFHNNSGFNTAEFTFDQFTGYEPMLYEMSSLLGIRLPEYNVMQSEGSKNVPQNFNTSAYNLRINPYRNYGVDIGVIGSLRSRTDMPFGLQDIIHTIGRYALHPNNDFNRLYIGGTYLNNNNAPF